VLKLETVQHARSITEAEFAAEASEALQRTAAVDRDAADVTMRLCDLHAQLRECVKSVVTPLPREALLEISMAFPRGPTIPLADRVEDATVLATMRVVWSVFESDEVKSIFMELKTIGEGATAAERDFVSVQIPH
jgi:hypothetical protein